MAGNPEKLVSIVVVTVGKERFLNSCLQSIEAQTYKTIEIIVIDDSLTDNLRLEVKNHFPKVKLFSSRKNLFYCDCLNTGIKLSCGDFVLCLNDDVILDERFIERALKGFFSNSRTGMVSGKILRSDKKTIDSTGLYLSYWRTTEERGYGHKDKGQFEKEEYIFGVNGAVAFYRKEMLDEIKEGEDYFDPTFHFFYEDLDIAWRAKQKGWRGYYIPNAKAYHFRGGSLRSQAGKDKPFARRFLDDASCLDLIKNRYMVIIKNESILGFFVHLPGIILYDLIAWSYVLFFRPQLIFKFLYNLEYLKKALYKRKAIKENNICLVNNKPCVLND